MARTRVQEIKHAQRESFLNREIAQAYQQITANDSSLAGLTLTRVALSPDKGLCTIYFFCPEGEEAYRKLVNRLILYKPSMRHTLAKTMQTRYTPELVFRYDKQREKQLRIDTLLERLKDEDRL